MPKHLLLATLEDSADVKSWSGIPFSLRVALEHQVDRLTLFRPSKPRRDPLNVALRLGLGGNPARWPLLMTEATLRQNARELVAAVKTSGADAVLSISSHCVARVNPFPVPTYMFSDSPWLAWKEAYAEYEPMPLRGKAFARAEAEAAARCSGLFFGSVWATCEAERLYFGGRATDEQRGRLHVTPLGANWRPEVSTESLLESVHGRLRERLDLLFVGRDWERKGGPLAVQVVERLRAAGANACLQLVGCRPELPAALTKGDQPAVRVHGALYQNVPAERAQLHELFLKSHLLLVPTKAECFGIAFAEAQAFGLPPVSRAIQALPSVVADGETGLLMAPDATAETYANRILGLMGDWAGYLEMAERGIERAAKVTSWDVMAESMARVIFGD